MSRRFCVIFYNEADKKLLTSSVCCPSAARLRLYAQRTVLLLPHVVTLSYRSDICASVILDLQEIQLRSPSVRSSFHYETYEQDTFTTTKQMHIGTRSTG